MIRIEPFRAEHLQQLDAQVVQAELAGDRYVLGRQLAMGGRCFTIRDDAGVVRFCGGITEAHADHATVWSAIAGDAGPIMTAITRRARWFLADLSHARVDAFVRPSHAAGKRWMAVLGFTEEARLAALFPDGEDGLVYRWMGRN